MSEHAATGHCRTAGEAECTRFDDLPFAQQFVVWSMRSWVAARRPGPATQRCIMEAFRRLDMQGGYRPLHDVMTLVAVSAARKIDVRCRNCRHLGYDEGLMIVLLNALQEYDMEGAAAVLHDWLPPAAARHAMKRAYALAAAMDRAGLKMRGAGRRPAGRTVH